MFQKQLFSKSTNFNEIKLHVEPLLAQNLSILVEHNIKTIFNFQCLLPCSKVIHHNNI